jgi:hypothetical protein
MSSDELASQRFAMALELLEAGEAIMRQNLRRKFPGADEADIERRLREWRLSRPGAPDGDALGKPGRWPGQAP